MKQYLVIGVEIMFVIEQFKLLLLVICWYYECWNGQGYLDGFVGENILFMVWIVVVVDIFDVVMMQWVYQDLCIVEEVFEIIECFNGIGFDFKVVEVFMLVYDLGVIQVLFVKYKVCLSCDVMDVILVYI